MCLPLETSQAMDTSSESDSYERRTRGGRRRGRDVHRRSGRDRGRDSGSGDEGRAADISDKISTLANTLQDTSRNLSKVDRMLGQYREHADDQAVAMTLLRESLEDSINQLQTQRLSRAEGPRGSSASTLHTSDLEACSGSEGQRFYPTSPLRDYPDGPSRRRRRRSQSAGVRFEDSSQAADKVHRVHQTLRDLRCDQLRLSDDLDREILRRNRSDIDTRRAMENLTEHMTVSPRQDTVSSRVERRLEELEREMQGEQRRSERERRPERRVAAADDQQEVLGRCRVGSDEREDTMTARLLRAERERSKMEQELGRARRLLEQSEESRESLVHQVEDMHGELLRTRAEKTALHRTQTEASQLGAQLRTSHAERDGGRGPSQGSDQSKLEKEVAELQAQLHRASVRGEVEELKRALDSKERENLRLSLQLKELSSDLEGREQQQLRILDQLKDIQSRGQAERREMEALLLESTRSRNELKTRAQEAVRQWRAKCRRLQKELEDARAQAGLHEDRALQASREKESSQAQLKALSQQSEAARRELGEILGRLAQREEELHRKDVELSETRQRQLLLQQEVQEVREASAALEQEAQRQAAVQARLREENQRLEEQADSQARRLQRDQGAQAELQAALKQMTAAHAQLSQRLAEEENARKELQKDTSGLQAKLALLQEERSALSQQLQLEREVHQKELENTKATIKDELARKDREVQETLKLCRQERDETKAQLSEVKAISQRPGLVKDPHRWLAETKTKLRWLCEEVRERDMKERRLRKYHQQTRDQLKAVSQSREAEQEALLQRLDQQEKLLLSLSTEKKELLERSRRKEEEMRSLQDRVLDLEMNTRVALEHLESIPEKKCLLEDFKYLEESQQQKEFVEQRYFKYREIVQNLQHQLDESKRRIQEYREEKLDATSRSLRLAALSSSIKGPGTLLSSTLRSDCLSPPRRLTATDLEDSTDEGSRLLAH
ncbi:centrosomal protein of 128 kDa isoform X3 [Fundulus heteroclitus]|uniref:centrosomal protein of 128 kDa isoform X3 n=1 Tax=Fundulus heteroclitus TaxID=8078 RepID=UPI00165A6E26|nr:centrosomal protein of 128 kDa isoform X3 [Fundulus heteroclitus]